MTPKKRSNKTKNFPDKLYPQQQRSGLYYSYRHPITKKYHSLGKDKALAFKRARMLNEKLVISDNTVDRILGVAGNTLSELIRRYKIEHLEEKKLAASTLQLIQYRLQTIETDIGNKLVESFSVQDVAEYLDTNFKNDAYIKHRGTLRDLFRFAMTKGYRQDNPAEVTLAKSDYEKKRQRLNVEGFNAIHSIAPEWMQIAMELALVTLQGRHEICHMKYSDIKDEHIYIIRQKTQKNEWAHIRIAVTPTINELIQRSRNSKVVTPFIIHREPTRRIRAKDREHWTQIMLNDFSKRFAKLRDSTGIFDNTERNERPTFHEIRSLGSWLYEKEGFDRAGYVQKLMAHADEKMTEHYQSGHEQKWLDVNADLTLKTVLK